MANILIIDDDPYILDIYSQFLEADGHSITTATNGQEGIDIFRDLQADLVITDMIMPVKNGVETIMELEKEFPDIKIIAISGGGAIESGRYLGLAKCIGIKQTLAKPISQKELILAVNNALVMPA